MQIGSASHTHTHSNTTNYTYLVLSLSKLCQCVIPDLPLCVDLQRDYLSRLALLLAHVQGILGYMDLWKSTAITKVLKEKEGGQCNHTYIYCATQCRGVWYKLWSCTPCFTTKLLPLATVVDIF